MSPDQIALVLSLVITPPYLYGTWQTVRLWAPAAWVALRTSVRDERHWLHLGVASHFIGSHMDGQYWTWPWSARYINSPSEEALFGAGIYFVIIGRQVPTIFAAYCHMRAARAADDPIFRHLMWTSTGVGALYAAALTWTTL